MGVVHQPIQDGVGQCVVTDGGIPLIDGQLADDHRRVSAVPVIHDLHQVVSVRRVQGFQSPVVQDQKVYFGQLVQGCIFWPIPITDSGLIRSPILELSDH